MSRTNYASSGSKTDSSLKSIVINNTKYIVKKEYQSNLKNECTESSAIAEQNNLKDMAKKYYEAHNTILIKDTKYVPVQLANNIVGIKIKSVTVSPNAFYTEPKITYKSTGSWANNSGSSNNSSSSTGSNSGSTTPVQKNYTFGNAKISGIQILSWDDYEMLIQFFITGGTTTSIPNNATIIDLKSSSGMTNFVFTQDSKTFMFINFYNSYEFLSTKWVSNSCTVTYRLYNEYSLYDTGVHTNRVSLYNKNTGIIDNVYLNTVPFSIEKYMFENYNKYNPVPYLEYITGLKFWIGLGIEGQSLEKNFESATSNMGNSIVFNARYDMINIKQLNIVNSLA